MCNQTHLTWFSKTTSSQGKAFECTDKITEKLDVLRDSWLSWELNLDQAETQLNWEAQAGRARL